VKFLIGVLGMATLGAMLCSGSEVFGYTGQDTTITSGGFVDTQFLIVSNTVDNLGVPEGGTGSPPFDAYVVDPSSVLANGYVINPGGTGALWDGPQADQTIGYPGPVSGFCCAGETTYSVLVNLTGFNLATTTLELVLAADDVVGVGLNGNTVFLGSGPMFNFATTVGPFSVSGDSLNSGVNFLNFVVSNYGGGPTGLDAFFEFDDGIPEPQTFTLMGLGLAGIAALRLRRRRAA